MSRYEMRVLFQKPSETAPDIAYAALYDLDQPENFQLMVMGPINTVALMLLDFEKKENLSLFYESEK